MIKKFSTFRFLKEDAIKVQSEFGRAVVYRNIQKSQFDNLIGSGDSNGDGHNRWGQPAIRVFRYIPKGLWYGWDATWLTHFEAINEAVPEAHSMSDFDSLLTIVNELDRTGHGRIYQIICDSDRYNTRSIFNRAIQDQKFKKLMTGKKVYFELDHSAPVIVEDGMVGGGAPTNSVGGGNIAGAGVGLQGEPGVNPKKKKPKVIKRIPMGEDFAGNKVFDLDTDAFHRCKNGKAKYHDYTRYVGDDEDGEAIRSYGRKNPGKPIIVRHKKTGAMCYLRYGKY